MNRPSRFRPWRLPWALLLAVAPVASAQKPAPPRPPEQRLPRLTCHAGYLELESARGLDGVLAAIPRAVARRDPAALGFLTERLAEVIGADADAALKAVDRAREATEPELSALLGAVRETDAVRAPAVVDRLVTMAESHPDPAHQAQALVALETQHHFGPELLDRLTALARRDTPAPGVALHAVRTLGRVGEKDFQRTGRFGPYMEKLLAVARGSPVKAVRSLAVEMGTYPDARLDGAAVEALGTLLREDPAPGVREMAALVLSSGRDTDAVLARFREAFPSEKNRCVRWALVRYAARAAGEQALPLLRDFAKADPRFQQDVADFQRLYASGLVDFNQVWLRKPMRQATCGTEEE